MCRINLPKLELSRFAPENLCQNPSQIMRILTFTTLYPNAVWPQFGIFVETRLRKLVRSGEVTARVMAPCPWFPLSNPRFGKYAAITRIPRFEERHGLAIDHPRYPLIPKIGMTVTPSLLFAAVLPILRRQIACGQDFDAIDAHYIYPDGVAAVMLGLALDRPVAVTCRGSDINAISKYRLPRQQITWAAKRAAALVTVSEGLRERVSALGIQPERISVLRNGVDLDVFYPVDRSIVRSRLGLAGRVLLSVGNLVKLKGHDLIIRALAGLPSTTLLVVGRGPERTALETLAQSVGVADRVRFLEPLPQERLRDIYSAADTLILASESEGWPNVLLESMACGTPVIATDIPGAREIVRTPEVGQLFRERTPESITQSVETLLASPTDGAAIRAYAAQFSWDLTTSGQLRMFEQITRLSRDRLPGS
jgi:teichuronic acid biosynthesis glycosyltransferase TuaC